MKMIFLGKKKKATTIVDDCDYEELCKNNWHLGANGYAYRNVYKGKNYIKGLYIHRIIINAMKGQEVDHINQIKLDNRRCNLRIVSSTINKINIKSRRDNTSGCKGVNWSSYHKKWEASIWVNKKHITLGRFKDKEKAIAIRKAAEVSEITYNYALMGHR